MASRETVGDGDEELCWEALEGRLCVEGGEVRERPISYYEVSRTLNGQGGGGRGRAYSWHFEVDVEGEVEAEVEEVVVETRAVRVLGRG